MTTVYKYKVFCQTENAWVENWTTTPESISTCPTNSSHTITSNSVTVLEEISEGTVALKNSVAGYFQVSTIVLDVPASAPNSVHIEDVSFPYEIEMWKTDYVSSADSVDDILNIIIGPDTAISVLTATGNINDTTLNLMSSIFSANVLCRGVHIKLFNGVSTFQDLGRITAIDAVNHTVTVENALTSTFNAGSPVLLNLYLVKNFYISAPSINFEFGSKGYSTKKIPPNTTIRILYTNSSGIAKKVYFGFEYNYS